MKKIQNISVAKTKMLKNFKASPQKLISLALIIGLVFSAVYFTNKYLFKKDPKEIYEVLVAVRDQSSSDPKEDAKSSLKVGNVLLAVKEGHQWSDTERISYLIIKMKLTEEQFGKISSPLDRELTKAEKKAEKDRFVEGREVSAEELKNYEEEIDRRRETIRARKYTIDMSEFEGFEPNVLLSGQPYSDQVYDWGIVKENK